MMRLETGRVAKLASGSVIISYGETAVLSTCQADLAPDSTSSRSVRLPREAQRLASSRWIPKAGRRVRRKFTMRMMDRPMRPSRKASR